MTKDGRTRRIQWTRRLRVWFLSYILGGAPLMRSVKRHMRMSKAVTVIVLCPLLVFLLLLFCQLTRKFVRFEHRSTKYYTDFAAACDLMLAHYPLSTNRFIEISPADANLPGIVRDLHPERIKTSTNWVWILVDGSHLDGLNVTWEPQDDAQTGTWNLVIGNGEGPSKVVYAAKR